MWNKLNVLSAAVLESEEVIVGTSAMGEIENFSWKPRKNFNSFCMIIEKKLLWLKNNTSKENHSNCSNEIEWHKMKKADQ